MSGNISCSLLTAANSAARPRARKPAPTWEEPAICRGHLEEDEVRRARTHLLCIEFVGPWCMEGPPSFLFMPGGGHMPEATCGCMPPMFVPMPGP